MKKAVCRLSFLSVFCLLVICVLLSPCATVSAKNRLEERGRLDAVRSSGQSVTPPNFVVLLTDDVDVDLLSPPLLNYFPNLLSVHGDSMRFKNAFVTTPLSSCELSRAGRIRVRSPGLG